MVIRSCWHHVPFFFFFWSDLAAFLAFSSHSVHLWLHFAPGIKSSLVCCSIVDNGGGCGRWFFLPLWSSFFFLLLISHPSFFLFLATAWRGNKSCQTMLRNGALFLFFFLLRMMLNKVYYIFVRSCITCASHIVACCCWCIVFWISSFLEHKWLATSMDRIVETESRSPTLLSSWGPPSQPQNFFCRRMPSTTSWDSGRGPNETGCWVRQMQCC